MASKVRSPKAKPQLRRKQWFKPPDAEKMVPGEMLMLFVRAAAVKACRRS